MIVLSVALESLLVKIARILRKRAGDAWKAINGGAGACRTPRIHRIRSLALRSDAPSANQRAHSCVHLTKEL